MQELTSLREQLLAAESASAGAVKESTHLRQQLRSLQSRSAGQATSPEQAELTRQVTPVIDQLLRETYTALRDEFQSDVTYKVRQWNSDFQLQPHGRPCFVAPWWLQAMLAHPYAVPLPDTTTGKLPTAAPVSQTMDMCAHLCIFGIWQEERNSEQKLWPAGGRD